MTVKPHKSKLAPTRLYLQFSLIAAMALLHNSAFAVNEKGEWPWNEKLHGFQDQSIAQELGTGWFLNVGPTGLRARITHEHPEFLTIKYVFQNSPAYGLIKIDDIIVGANGTRLTVPHTFGHRVPDGVGWKGPMADMAKLIEDSQGKDGKLQLLIWPGGSKAAEKIVTLKIPAVGRFSPTWPFKCPRSDKLMIELCDFLAAEHKRAGKFESMVQTQTASTLALMASGDHKYDPLIKQIMSGYQKNRYDANHEPGFASWGFGYDSILMAEYYMQTQDKSLLPAIESLSSAMSYGQCPIDGGFSHKPFPAIQRVVAAGGPKGYGEMAMTSGIAMLGMSLLKEAGLPYPQAARERLHQAYLNSVSPNGSIGYGLNGWDHAVIELQDPLNGGKSSPLGIGYQCPLGMKDIGKYNIEWPTKADPRYKPTDWIAAEAPTNLIYDMGKQKRLVIRTMLKPEPMSPFKQNGKPCDHFGRSGVGALANLIGSGDNPSWHYMSDLLATGSAKSADNLLSGHASTHSHVLWGSLGAALASEKDFHEYMEGIKWWFIMAQSHDGSYVVMPGRDYASTDHVYGTRNLPTACAALILSLKEKRLQITGAPRLLGKQKNTTAQKPPVQVVTPAVKPVPKPSKILLVSAAAMEQWQARFVKKLDSLVKSGAKIKVAMDGGENYPVMNADEKALNVSINGNTIPMPWKILSVGARANLAISMAKDSDLEALLIAAVMLVASDEPTKAEDVFLKASVLDSEAVKSVKAALTVSVEKAAP